MLLCWCCAVRNDGTDRQTDRQTDTIQMHYAYRSIDAVSITIIIRPIVYWYNFNVIIHKYVKISINL